MMQEGPSKINNICNNCNFLGENRKNDGHGGVYIKYTCNKNNNIEIIPSLGVVLTPTWCPFIKLK